MAYGVFIPAAAGLTAYVSGLASLLLLLAVYSALFLRVRASRRHRGDRPLDATVYAAFTVLGKFAQALGLLIYIWRRKILKDRSRLIEYKDANQGPSDAFRD